jgi:hypothetical protein
MSAALIPAQLVPIARTDADWAFDIDFQGEDWTGSEVSVAFARQGLSATRFEVETVVPSAPIACPIRVPASFWADKPAGTYTVEVRKIDAGAIDDAAVFRLMLYTGGTDTREPVAPPAGDGTATGGVIVSRVSSVTVVRSGGVMGPPGATNADFIAFDPTGTDLVSVTLGDAIRELANREPTGPTDPVPFWTTNPGLLGAI